MPKKNEGYRASDTITISTLSDPVRPRAIHPELLRFSRIVSKIGVLGFSVKNLRQYMGEGFHKARITYIYLGNELAGFFIAVYRKDGDGYSGSGFPCIKYKFRGNAVRNAANIEGETYINERRAVSSPFTAMMASLIFDFINFYWRDVNQGNWSNLIPDLIGAIEQQIRRKNPKSQLILDMCLEMANLFVPRNGNLTIRAIAENPIMYQKLMEMNLTFDGQDPRPSQKELEKIANWDTKKLLSESYIQSKRRKQHPCIERPPFAVSLLSHEWQHFFERAGHPSTSRDAKYSKYFLWQNYNFPNSAFEFRFKVNLANIWEVIKTMFANNS